MIKYNYKRKRQLNDFIALNDNGVTARKEVNKAKAAATIRWVPFKGYVIHDVKSVLNKNLVKGSNGYVRIKK